MHPWEITISFSALLFYQKPILSFSTIHHLASGGILVGIAELLLEFYAYHWTLPPPNWLTNVESWEKVITVPCRRKDWDRPMDNNIETWRYDRSSFANAKHSWPTTNVLKYLWSRHFRDSCTAGIDTHGKSHMFSPMGSFVYQGWRTLHLGYADHPSSEDLIA